MKTVKLNGNRILSYEEYGDPTGKPVLYFHGWPGSRLEGQVFNETCQKLGIRLLCIDRPGYGKSTYVENRTLGDWAKDMQNLTENLNLNSFSVIGVSGGAPYALAVAHRNISGLNKVVIASGLGPLCEKGKFKDRSWVDKVAMELPAKSTFAYKIMFSIMNFLVNKLPKVYTALLWTGLSKNDRRVFIKLSRKDNILLVHKEAFSSSSKTTRKDAVLYCSPWDFKLGDISKPIDLWYGDEDKLTPLSMGKYYEKEISNAKLYIIPNQGHLLAVDYKEKIFETF